MNLKLFIVCLVLLGIVPFLLTTGCSSKKSRSVQIYCLSLNQTNKTIVTNLTSVQLYCELNGRNSMANWTSSSPGVASVHPVSGLVTPIANGTTKIRASVDGKENYCYVKVVIP